MDLNVRAFRVIQAAITGQETTVDARKMARRKAGLAGGPSCAKSTGAKHDREIA
ncbi:MAG: hypothetical protein WBQ08_00580 [Candidatus Sulfotelmatobacter sp.]